MTVGAGGLAFGFGKISIFSSRDNEPSLESPAHKHGYFTYHLLRAWEKGLRSADEVYGYVYEAVEKDTKGVQHPRRDYRETEGKAATY